MQQKSTILIIEDDQAAAKVLVQLCRDLGYRPLVAYDGVTGLELAAKKRPRLILSDPGVPGLDGFELARRVRANQQLDKTAVVALTGHVPPTPAANQIAFDDYLVKPITSDNVQHVISKYCSLS
jgi:CheY-like chemotaxis protein